MKSAKQNLKLPFEKRAVEERSKTIQATPCLICASILSTRKALLPKRKRIKPQSDPYTPTAEK